MATTEPGGGSRITTCPLCEDYSGEPSSVEAHISRLTDDTHQGEVGRAHRDELQPGVDASSDVEGSSDVPSADGGHPLEDTDTMDPDGQEDEAGEEIVDDLEDEADQEESENESESEQVEEERVDVEESMGVPLPVSTTTLFISVGVFLLVAFWWSQRQQATQPAQTEQQSGQGRTHQGTGLIE